MLEMIYWIINVVKYFALMIFSGFGIILMTLMTVRMIIGLYEEMKAWFYDCKEKGRITW